MEPNSNLILCEILQRIVHFLILKKRTCSWPQLVIFFKRSQLNYTIRYKKLYQQF
ncbi:unnamed protein product [Paramecium pentaurelia]|uniref:Uncharacterized protein n=1 Tax=Paramecium pentaurelia TaxID=43138 RepID=A0A8S1T6V0_9CILI|nr:unnamed protein product [Paramecium pentaurelia]